MVELKDSNFVNNLRRLKLKKTYSLIALALLCVLANCEKKAEDTAATTVTEEAPAPAADAAAAGDASTDAAAPAAE
jgi:hypothetical protein